MEEVVWAGYDGNAQSEDDDQGRDSGAGHGASSEGSFMLVHFPGAGVKAAPAIGGDESDDTDEQQIHALLRPEIAR